MGRLVCSSAIRPDAGAGALREYAERNSSRAIGNFTLAYKVLTDARLLAPTCDMTEKALHDRGRMSFGGASMGVTPGRNGGSICSPTCGDRIACAATAGVRSGLVRAGDSHS